MENPLLIKLTNVRELSGKEFFTQTKGVGKMNILIVTNQHGMKMLIDQVIALGHAVRLLIPCEGDPLGSIQRCFAEHKSDFVILENCFCSEFGVRKEDVANACCLSSDQVRRVNSTTESVYGRALPYGAEEFLKVLSEASKEKLPGPV